MHVRNFRLLWFVLGREYRKCRECDCSDVSEQERQRREKDPRYPDYWQKQVNVEKSTATILTAISTLVEDASQITLRMYIIIVHGEQETVLGQFSFYPRDAMLARVFATATCLSVCPSVCPSVTRRYCD